MGTQCDIAVRFHPPPPDLAFYFTTFYRVEITVADGGKVADALQPEWGNLRFFFGDVPVSRIGDGPEIAGSDFVPTGPSSLPLDFTLGTTCIWGLGFLPVGWCMFMGVPANEMANQVFDGRREAAYSPFLPLADRLSGTAAEESADVERLVHFFRHEAPRHRNGDPRVGAIHAMLLEDDLPDVASMAERVGLSQRTLERLTHRAFGFPPKLLLRRQRFMRSLASFMLNPEQRWTGALDRLYYDQSHFVRDCRKFLGMAPSEYAAMEHPIMTEFVRERFLAHGSAVQTLDRAAPQD